MSSVEPLFIAIRDAAEKTAWSKGVELTRSGTISGVSIDGQAVVLQVAAAGALASRSVILYVDDCEWQCDCKGDDDPCEHVTASVIALKKARSSGKQLPDAPATTARIRYLLTRTPAGLSFARAFVRADSETVFEATLLAIQAGRVQGPPFLATPADLQVDLVLGMRTNGVLSKETFLRIFDVLVDCPDVRLDGQPVKLSRERAGMRAVLDDQGTGFRLSIEPDPAISEHFLNGVVLWNDELRVLEEPRLSGRELEELRRGKHFTAEQRVELFTAVVPDLQSRLHVELRTRRRPRLGEQRARVELQLEREGDALSVLPLLVYGDPAVARVDKGTLVLLGDVLPPRDEDEEQRLARKLKDDLGLMVGFRENFLGEKGVAFAAKLARWKGGVRGEAHHQFFMAAPLVPRLAMNGDAFDLSFESIEGRGPGARNLKADAGAVVRAWRNGESLVPLLDGGFAPLPADWMAKFGHRVADLLAAKNAKDGTLPASALPDLAKLCEALEQPAPPSFRNLRPLMMEFDQLPAATLPADLLADLRPYQRKGIDWLCFLRSAKLGALLADDMGLGKTLQAIAALQPPALVVAPTSVLFNWQAEIARFRPSLKVSLFHGPRRALDPTADVTLTSYALLRLDQELLSNVKWKTVVLDESQAIKNADSQVARAAFTIRGDFRVALTGTPVENRLDELWSQFHYVNPGLLGGRSDFDDRYAKPMAGGDPDATARLRERLKPFILRRHKRDVAPELPPRIEQVLRCELTADERQLYDAIHAATKEEVVERLATGGNVLAALEALLRLRQASCHAGLLPGQDAPTSSKVELLLETLKTATAEGHRSLVFSQWTSLLDKVEPHLTAAGLPFLRIDGSTTDRKSIVEAFQADSGPPVLLLSLKAAGAGLNLTAADHVFLLDPWWNPAVEDQAADRAHRIGQNRSVIVHRLVAIGTVEERILELQGSKRALAEAALSGTAAAASLSRDDLLALLA